MRTKLLIALALLGADAAYAEDYVLMPLETCTVAKKDIVVGGVDIIFRCPDFELIGTKLSDDWLAAKVDITTVYCEVGAIESRAGDGNEARRNLRRWRCNADYMLSRPRKKPG